MEGRHLPFSPTHHDKGKMRLRLLGLLTSPLSLLLPHCHIPSPSCSPFPVATGFLACLVFPLPNLSARVPSSPSPPSSPTSLDLPPGHTLIWAYCSAVNFSVQMGATGTYALSRWLCWKRKGREYMPLSDGLITTAGPRHRASETAFRKAPGTGWPTGAGATASFERPSPEPWETEVALSHSLPPHNREKPAQQDAGVAIPAP